MHELFEHTADLGLRITADDLPSLFRQAAECLFSAIVEDVSTIRPLESVTIDIPGMGELDYLLFDWLNAILYYVDAERKLFSRFDVEQVGPGVKAVIWGEPMDRDRHPLSHEVKAITYHGLIVEPIDAGWRAEVIVDI